MIEVLNKTQIIRKRNCEVQISEIQDGHNRICHVVCTGKSRRFKWQQSFKSNYGDCAMLVGKSLIDLPGKRFLVHQINEHSRGGHHECEVYLLDLCGKILNQFAGSYNSKILLDDKYIWFYISRKKTYSDTFNLDLKMIKLNYTNGLTTTVLKGELPSQIEAHFWN